MMDIKIPILISVTIHGLLIAALGFGLGVGGKTMSGSKVVFVTLTAGDQVSDRRENTQKSQAPTRSGSDDAEMPPIPRELVADGETDVPPREEETLSNAPPQLAELPLPLREFELSETISGKKSPEIVEQAQLSEISSLDLEFSGITIPDQTGAGAAEGPPSGILSSEMTSGMKGVFTPAATVILPEPEYPSVSRRLGEEGTVTLVFLVGPDGRADNVTVMESSGYYRLDRAARASLRSARFEPATRQDVPVAMSRKMAISFRLKD